MTNPAVREPVLVVTPCAAAQGEGSNAYLEPRGVPCFMEAEQPFQVLAVLARYRQTVTRSSAA